MQILSIPKDENGAQGQMFSQCGRNKIKYGRAVTYYYKIRLPETCSETVGMVETLCGLRRRLL